MEKFEYKATTLPDLIQIKPQVFEDERGYFLESYNQAFLERLGVKKQFVQDNESCSKKNVLRGLHFQYKEPQGKLVRVIKGMLFDVAVDLRQNSPTFGKWEGFILSDENKMQLYIPEGFAHGFLVLSEEVIFHYKCTSFYRPEYEGGILWNDPTLAIQWPIEDIGLLILSEKDKKQQSFATYQK
ncbi:dTDP-4-dehydrorhamnose 3,5-epimerase [Sporanaerobium hydrogeniformans]|uniref:dTDP-4-dehydrorhamnose 3,5-epimerase n=1 Tax=Sporanaerobium hydrogeniformans TaxID=3072179 RepID=A0AC61DDN4_9FIRM|nr:dTDP-4-dehydrorhamnose 3,5-epimerase [Sporanaerobium hydrogeniformans]PHV70883.1 dTDP-4-dehydrorhamnose 3,5-epimerase [Sporanaerobium hydrogeniformans]